MKRTGIFLAIACILISVSLYAAGTLSFSDSCDGDNITRTYNVGNFDALTTKVTADVYFTQTTDGSSSLRISGESKYVESTKVVVIEGVLTITSTAAKKTKNNGTDKVRIDISAPTLKKIVSTGVGDVKVNGKFTVNDLTIISKGVGDVVMNDLNCKNLDVTLTGVGDVELVGKANTAEMSLSGVGDIEAYKLEVENLNVTSRGVGDLKCYATKSLNATSSGVGSIRYKGSPKTKQIVSKGIGGVKKK
jgi:hypothetical protein